MDTQTLTLDHMRDFSLYSSVGQVAQPQRSTSLSLTSVLRQTSTMILAGGQGERLSPLTRDRAKPAVPSVGFIGLSTSLSPIASILACVRCMS
jgi:hypothetical protein